MSFQTQAIEFDELITPDGLTYKFNPRIYKFSWGNTGYGMPPISYITQRGPFQDGESVLDYRIDSRVLQLTHRRNECSRDDYWDARSELINFLRPNRQPTNLFQTFALRKILPDGTKRDINVLYQEGLQFRPSQTGQWDEWSIQEPIIFVAHDPIFFNPTENVTQVTMPIVSGAELMFPITFPIRFSSRANAAEATIVYNGNYRSFPIITLRGPMRSPIIRNITTNEKLEFIEDFEIDGTEFITIDTTFGQKTVEDNNGNNLIGQLTTDSNLTSFHIAPDPEAEDGENEIGFTADELTANSGMSIRYFDKYIGI
jgi:hypothetical protein